jgi:bifunctional non-homologous end joining protein LigD
MRRERQTINAADIPGSVQAPAPESLAPQLATLVDSVPTKGDWLYEIKLDGYRLMTRFKSGEPALITRRGHDWSAKMPGLVKELASLGVESGWLDGEIVVLRDNGVPDFNALQNAFDRRTSAGIVYFLFDVPFFDGYDLRQARLRDRRTFLESFLAERGTDNVRISATFDADPRSILESACRMGLEGVIAKRANAFYVSRRTDDWIKLKCKKRQEFVIAGYMDRSGTTRQVGSLILGVYESGELVPAGSVGTGFDSEQATALKTKLAKLEQKETPFAGGVPKPGRWSKRKPGEERWVRPTLVAEVEFAEWTPEGHVRHASFISLRADKAAREVVREIETKER